MPLVVLSLTEHCLEQVGGEAGMEMLADRGVAAGYFQPEWDYEHTAVTERDDGHFDTTIRTYESDDEAGRLDENGNPVFGDPLVIENQRWVEENGTWRLDNCEVIESEVVELEGR